MRHCLSTEGAQAPRAEQITLKRTLSSLYKRDSWERKREVTTGSNSHPELPLPAPREEQHRPLSPTAPNSPTSSQMPISKEASGSSCSHPHPSAPGASSAPSPLHKWSLMVCASTGVEEVPTCMRFFPACTPFLGTREGYFSAPSQRSPLA